MHHFPPWLWSDSDRLRSEGGLARESDNAVDSHLAALTITLKTRTTKLQSGIQLLLHVKQSMKH
eukprot:CAMPEP_0175993466 /NCGR_PEP_ID=MMETSP0108-20121206/53982_1 /TAXON_ID=195067 ORGANISM="Goniomonas pacifica, Strain CCMP1869" /NCGR_SAMPLE_ID=MMETSP0108 /ASSEMBLY_ACC=CAM_ASM_000204 /LENGTH=63 /DNA_ID=CAMNT_0017325261 /DNA_START=70 /DNA_END=258 /DNA_ORIENTATION=+